MITLALKKSILNDWNAIFPQLSTYSQTTLYVTLDIMVVGLLLLRVRGEDEYRPIFQVYPLWKRDNKDNLFSPIVNKPILHITNIQIILKSLYDVLKSRLDVVYGRKYWLKKCLI